jgi:hypothetical protein
VLALLVVTTIGLVVPVLSSTIGCEEDGGVDCCDLDCALCVCCSHTPQTVLRELDPGSGNAMDGRLLSEGSEKPRAPLPRDVLHVPRCAPVC